MAYKLEILHNNEDTKAIVSPLKLKRNERNSYRHEIDSKLFFTMFNIVVELTSATCLFSVYKT